MAETPASDTATLATLNDDTKRRSRNHVDVHQAEAEFTRLQRDLSGTDTDYEHRAQSSTPQPKHLPKDLEKASPDDAEAAGERFDLREYLASSNDANQAAGIKHKHVGVTWDDLEVTGIGGEDNKASFHSMQVFSRPLTSPLDLCSHSPCCNFGGAHVPRHVNTGSDFTPPSRQVDACSSNTYDHPPVSLIVRSISVLSY